MYVETFDEPYQTPGETIDASVFAESWSGYCLDRTGQAPLSPWIMPLAAPTGRILNTQRGAVRFWYRPSFDSGTGPGTLARLLTLASADGPAVTTYWSLAISPDGNTIQLLCDGNANGAVCLTASAALQAGVWNLVTLGYTETNSALWINTQQVATGGGVPSLSATPVPSAALLVGSDAFGDQIAAGQIDLLTTFSGSTRWPRPTASPFGLDPSLAITAYYADYSPVAALGPISPEEQANPRQFYASHAILRSTMQTEDDGSLIPDFGTNSPPSTNSTPFPPTSTNGLQLVTSPPAFGT